MEIATTATVNLRYDDIALGAQFESAAHTVTEADIATFAEADESSVARRNGGTATLTPRVWTPPAPALTMPIAFPDNFEVLVFASEGGASLVAAIELVSPANKDRQAHRRAFAIKCASYLCRGVGLIVIDIVTSELPQEIAELSSRVLQHEIDHLHGVLFIDKMGPLGKLSARASLREFEREFRKAQEKGEYPSDAEIEKRLKEQADGNGTPPVI